MAAVHIAGQSATIRVHEFTIRSVSTQRDEARARIATLETEKVELLRRVRAWNAKEAKEWVRAETTAGLLADLQTALMNSGCHPAQFSEADATAIAEAVEDSYSIPPDAPEKRFTLKLICCGREDGPAPLPMSWEEANAFREKYTSGPGVATSEHEPGHARIAIIVEVKP